MLLPALREAATASNTPDALPASCVRRWGGFATAAWQGDNSRWADSGPTPTLSCRLGKWMSVNSIA